MKRFCILVLIMSLCLVCAMIAHSETYSGTAGELTWSIENGVLTITGDGVIPNYSSGGAPWYDYREATSRIVIGDGITSIGNYAFAGMSSPGRITLGANITTIGDDAFSGCSSLTGIIFPEGLLSIGDSAFSDCSSLASITLPESLTKMGASAFYDCDALGTVKTGNGLKAINEETFYDCDALTTLIIGDEVTKVGSLAFYSCNSLVNVTIGKSVTTIGDNAFDACDGLTNIVIPDNVTSIGDQAFYMSGLENATVGNGVTNIGEYAFASCIDLANISLGNGLTSISNYAFRNCDSLSSIVIPNNVTNIGNYAFDGCNGMSKVILGENVVKLGACAFSNCSVMKTIMVKEWITTVETSAFDQCNSLADVYYAGTEEDRSYITIKTGNSAFTGATWHYGAEMPHTLELVAAVDATCTEAGSISHYRCIDCGQIFSDAEAKNKLTDADIIIDALGHNWGEWTVTRAATATEPGEKTRTCARCMEIETEEIPMISGETYTVHYDANQGEGAPEDQVKMEGESLILSDILPTRADYVFRAWNDVADGSGKAYVPGTDYEVEEDVTLYAQWIWEKVILNLPKQVKIIESEAFLNVSAEAVRIPAGVIEIGEDALQPSLIIITAEGSYAAQWAEEHHFECILE